MKREDVYKLLDSERAHQDKVNNAIYAQSFKIGEELLLMKVYLDDAIDQWKTEPHPEMKTRELVRKIGAIAVRAMETYDTPAR